MLCTADKWPKKVTKIGIKSSDYLSQTVCSADPLLLYSHSLSWSFIISLLLIIESQDEILIMFDAMLRLKFGAGRPPGALWEALPLRPLKARGLLRRQRQSRGQPGRRPSFVQEQNGASFSMFWLFCVLKECPQLVLRSHFKAIQVISGTNCFAVFHLSPVSEE